MVWGVGFVLLVAVAIWVRLGWRAAALRRRFPPVGRIVEVEGRRVHALTLGAGPDLVLIHGSSGQLRDLMPLVERLARRFRVTAFDRPGMGHSDPIGAEGISPAGQARHLARAAAVLGITAPLVLGQSYGGTVALAWGLQVQGAQAARGLVLVSSPSLPWVGKLDWWYQLTATRIGRVLAVPLASALVTEAFVDRMIPALFAPSPAPEGYAARIGAALALAPGALGVNADQVNGLLPHVRDMARGYAGLSVPVEMVHGLHDPIVPLDQHSGPLARLLPHARLTVLEDAGHMPHHTHPGAVVAACLRLTESLEAVRPPDAIAG